MTIFILIITVSALIFTVIQNRRLALQLAALAAAQTTIEERINQLGRKSKKQTNTARRHEQKIERLHRKQREQAERQTRIEKEQQKQAANINKLQFTISQAESDIAAAQDRLTSLFAILDCIRAQQADAVPGSSADIRLARQAVVLESQIATAERKLAKAQFDKSAAQANIAA